MKQHVLRLVLFVLVTVGLLVGSTTAARATPVTIEVSPQLPTTQDSLIISVTGLGQAASFRAPNVVGNDIALNGTSSRDGTLSTRFSLAPLAAGDYTIRVVIDDMLLATLSFRISAPQLELDLADGIFAVFTSWVDSQGTQHVAKAVKLSDNSGYFWFFDSSNTEVTIKILDGRPVNGHFWVFIASMTTVRFSLSIFDKFCLSLPIPPCGPLRTYDSPAGKNRNFIDLGSL